MTLTALKRAYAQATASNLDQFTVLDNGEERLLLTSYARYLIEYLTSRNVREFTFKPE